jgi:hypothetical protein
MRREDMKFVLAFTNRAGGSSAEAEQGQRQALELLGKFQPSDSVTIHQWVTRCDGGGGFAVTETDDAEAMLYDLSVWSPMIDFQVFPVVDVGAAAAVQQRAIEFRANAG